MAEKSKDGKLAIDIMVAIPIELNRAQRESMIHTLAESLVVKGMIIDYAIHNPPKRDDLGRPLDADGMPTSNPDKMQYLNPHCHIMIPIRPLGAGGRFIGKSTTEYVCKHPDDGTVKRLTQQEIKESNIEWQKMFLCEVDGLKEYHTKPEIEKYGYKRIGRNALMTRHGRPSSEYAYRMSTQFVKDIRMLWEEIANKALKDAGLDERIDCRSYTDQNSQKIAEMHLGPSIATMQKKIFRLQSDGKGISDSLKCDMVLLNKEIRKHNHMIDFYESRLASVESEHYELDVSAQKLAVIKSAWISERCHRRELEQQIVKLTEDMEALQDKVKNYKSAMSSIEQKISSLISEKEDLEALLGHKN